MILQDISELHLVGVFERGVPNQERIVLRATTRVDLGQFGVLLGVKTSPGMAAPIKDNLFWFGDGLINRDDWIFIYTCPGKPGASQIPNREERVYTLFWGRKSVILQNPNILPVLFRVDAVIVGDAQPLLPEKAS